MICIATAKLLTDNNTRLGRPGYFCKIKFIWSRKGYENMRLLALHLIKKSYHWKLPHLKQNGCTWVPYTTAQRKCPLRIRPWSNRLAILFLLRIQVSCQHATLRSPDCNMPRQVHHVPYVPVIIANDLKANTLSRCSTIVFLFFHR
jgi:hypothetical protein